MPFWTHRAGVSGAQGSGPVLWTHCAVSPVAAAS